jgi:cbb3-type cytochrome oxidase cytochrome c subunit
MGCSKSQHQEREMSSAQAAQMYVRQMIEVETRGWGHDENTLARLGERYGLSKWTLNHLRTGRAKTVEAGVFARIRAAYIAVCESQIKKLEQQIAVEKAMGTDDHLEDLARQASDLAALVQAKKQIRAGK